MNKKLILGIVILVIVALASFVWLNAKRWVEPPLVPSPATSPVSLPSTTDGYVYDAKLNYGFNYPSNWEFSVSIDKSIAQCDSSLSYEVYNCVEFPDKTIKKVIIFTKKTTKDGAVILTDIEFTVKSAMGLQEITDKLKKDAEMSGMPILNETAISISNINGYDMLAGTADWKLRQVVFLSNGFAYIFKYSSQDEFYRINEETFNSAINSFKVK